jgi:hypothetical protein
MQRRECKHALREERELKSSGEQRFSLFELELQLCSLSGSFDPSTSDKTHSWPTLSHPSCSLFAKISLTSLNSKQFSKQLISVYNPRARDTWVIYWQAARYQSAVKCMSINQIRCWIIIVLWVQGVNLIVDTSADKLTQLAELHRGIAGFSSTINLVSESLS